MLWYYYRAYYFDCRIDQSGVMTLEKAITAGKPVLVSGIKESLNNLVMPLIYHYNTLNEDHIDNGKHLDFTHFS